MKKTMLDALEISMKALTAEIVSAYKAEDDSISYDYLLNNYYDRYCDILEQVVKALGVNTIMYMKFKDNKYMYRKMTDKYSQWGLDLFFIAKEFAEFLEQANKS